MRNCLLALLALLVSCSLRAQQPGPGERGYLFRAGANAEQILRALEEAPEQARADLVFLLTHMRRSDLESLSAEFLLENVELARRARAEAPWGPSIPEEVYRNAVLPHAQVDEPRDPWRADFRRRFLPLVAKAATPGEAAQILNRTVFKELGVRYSTERKRANQSPRESIEQGKASCTGLSIILADACRAVGVPARLAGVASWAKKEGNHTWVEIWSEGRWHYMGAAEPAERLNEAWFAADAAAAVPGSIEKGVFAASYAASDRHFPMVWSPEDREVAGIEVTSRYAPSDSIEPDGIRLMVRVRRAGRRVEVPVRVERVAATAGLEGRSRGEEADTNDILEFGLPADDAASWRVRAGEGSGARSITWRAGEARSELIEIELPAEETLLPGKIRARLGAWFDEAFKAIAAGSTLPEEPDDLRALLRAEGSDRAVRRIAFDALRSSTLVADRRAEFDRKVVRSGEHESAYTLKEVGDRPEGGWPLVIALHGGGGAPKKVNDQQWRHMQIYYRDHPEAGGYLYLALRAPNDTWNGFYDDYVYPLVERLIATLILFGDVDPDRVHVIGYSHGGYGVFSIAPKIADRFAAAHASAAAPTDGETSARPLRNLPFSFMVGEKDEAYGRIERCRRFAATLDELKRKDPRGWPAEYLEKSGFGHGGLPDRDILPTLLVHRRDLLPDRLDWELTDATVRRHYWLATDDPGKKRRVRAEIADNRLQVETDGIGELRARLDARLVDFDRPFRLAIAGEERVVELRPSLGALARSLAASGDPELAHSVELPLVRP